MNLKIPFYTPEEYFLGDRPANFILGAFNPQDYIPTPISSQNGTSVIATKLQIPVITPSTEPDVILFVGSPASGKSTFYRDHLHPMGYTRINQDTLKTRDRCVAEASTLLAESTPIVIGFFYHLMPLILDNTNADKNTRKIWIDLANQFDRNIRCIHFTASPQLARHNNLVRALGGTAKVVSPILQLME
jgi:bifunctional polynucleotide phosphatase/kinase